MTHILELFSLLAIFFSYYSIPSLLLPSLNAEIPWEKLAFHRKSAGIETDPKKNGFIVSGTFSTVSKVAIQPISSLSLSAISSIERDLPEDC